MNFLPEPIQFVFRSPRLFEFSSHGVIPYSLRQKWTGHVKIPTNTDLSGQAILVMGATNGAGREAARQLSQLGATVLIGARNIERAEDVQRSIAANSNRGAVKVYELDMASFAFIDRFIERLAGDMIELNVALLNAGLLKDVYATRDGIDSLFQINFVGTAYLATRLIPILKGATPSRLVITTSEGHAWTKYRAPDGGAVFPPFLEPLQNASVVDCDDRYFTAKLFLMLFGRELASRIDAKQTKIVMTSPGFAASNFFEKETWGRSLVYWAHARPLEQCGRLHVHAIVNDGDGWHGGFLGGGKVERLSPYAESEEGKRLQKRVWKEFQDFKASQGLKMEEFERGSSGKKIASRL